MTEREKMLSGALYASEDPELAAARIAWGKFLNAGQTCVAPDHVWVPEGMAEPFVAALIGIFAFHEAVTPYKLLGMAAIFGAILILNRRPETGPSLCLSTLRKQGRLLWEPPFFYALFSGPLTA